MQFAVGAALLCCAISCIAGLVTLCVGAAIEETEGRVDWRLAAVGAGLSLSGLLSAAFVIIAVATLS